MQDPTDTELATATPMATRPHFLPTRGEYVVPTQLADRLRELAERRRDSFPRIVVTDAEDGDALMTAAAVHAARVSGQEGGFRSGMTWGLGFGFLAGSIAMTVAFASGYFL